MPVIRVFVTSLVLVTSATLAFGAPRADITLGNLAVERKGEEVSVAVKGTVKLPDGTRAQVRLFLAGDPKQDGLVAHGEVHDGAFGVRFGPFAKQLLPGAYTVSAKVDARLQAPKVAEALKGYAVIPAKKVLQVGTEAEAKREAEKLKRSYMDVVEELREVHGSLGMWGTSTAMKSAGFKILYVGKVPKKVSKKVVSAWMEFGETFRGALSAIRFELKSLGGYVVLSRFPGATAILSEILTSLDRLHTAYTAAITDNLGVKLELPGVPAISALRPKLLRLAERCYRALGEEPVSWKLIGAGTPERLEDAKGDLFRSTVSKFEVRKPGKGWFFDPSPVEPTLRLRLRVREPEELQHKIVAGIELSDYPFAESFGDLARQADLSVRRRWPGFELISSKRFSAKDETMPGGKRPGLEMHYKTTTAEKDGKRPMTILHYMLFCRWHKRTYSVLSIAEEGSFKEAEPLFRGIFESFKVLDAPKGSKLKPKKKGSPEKAGGGQ